MVEALISQGQVGSAGDCLQLPRLGALVGGTTGKTGDVRRGGKLPAMAQECQHQRWGLSVVLSENCSSHVYGVGRGFRSFLPFSLFGWILWWYDWLVS